MQLSPYNHLCLPKGPWALLKLRWAGMRYAQHHSLVPLHYMGKAIPEKIKQIRNKWFFLCKKVKLDFFQQKMKIIYWRDPIASAALKHPYTFKLQINRKRQKVTRFQQNVSMNLTAQTKPMHTHYLVTAGHACTLSLPSCWGTLLLSHATLTFLTTASIGRAWLTVFALQATARQPLSGKNHRYLPF